MWTENVQPACYGLALAASEALHHPRLALRAHPSRFDWPDDVVNQLAVFAERLRSARSAGVKAVYVHGSLVLGDYQPGRSDIDFTGITDAPLTQSVATELTRLHRRLRLRFPRVRLNGSYLSGTALAPGAISHEPVLSIDGWSTDLRSTADRNEVTRFELATRAVPLFGPAASDLVGPPDQGALRAYLRQNMNDYWVPWVQRAGSNLTPAGLAAIVAERRIEWGVLGVTRQLYTLLERDVISKTGASEYMLERAPPEHVPVLKEALRQRAGLAKIRYVNVWTRRRAALAYMTWVINQANCEIQNRK